MHSHARTVITLHDDLRLLTAVGSVVHHAAERVGLARQVQEQFASAAEEACREAFPLVNGHERSLRCIVEDFDDRLEVVLEHQGKKAHHAEEQALRKKISAAIDELKFDIRSGVARVVLIKFLPRH